MKLDEEDIAFNFDSQESTKISIDRLVSLLGQPIELLAEEALLIVAPGPGSFISTRQVRELLLRRQQSSRSGQQALRIPPISHGLTDLGGLVALDGMGYSRGGPRLDR